MAWNQSESVFEVTDSNDAIVQAQKNGWAIVFPKDNQLQIDLDSEEAYQQFKAKIGYLKGHWNVVSVAEHFSKSGAPRRHVTVTLDSPVEELMRIGLQAVLGSDPKRELFGLIRVKQGDPRPTLFFEKLGEVYLGKET